MIRQAWVMTLKPGAEAEYKARHDDIWPEMVALMRRDGITSYSIYRYGLTLFAYLERERPAPPEQAIEPVVWRWWQSMAPLMETNPDTSPVMQPVEEMFHFPK